MTRPILYTGLAAMALTSCDESGFLNQRLPPQEIQKIEGNYISDIGEKKLNYSEFCDGRGVHYDQIRPVLGDMDGDGDLDIVIARFNKVIVIENKIPQKVQK